MLLVLLACTENELKNLGEVVEEPVDTQAPVELLPGVEVDPLEVDVGVVCEEGSADITIRSVGEAELYVTEVVLPTGWWLGDAEPPWTLAPGEEKVVTLNGVGDGEVRIVTDAGEVTVAVTGSVEPPPQVEWVYPAMDQVLPTGQASMLEVLAIEADEVVFSSDVAGELGTSPVTDNAATFLWDPSLYESGVHTLLAIGSDACNYDSEELRICQQEGYTEGDIDLANWVTTGTAFWDSSKNRLQLTAAAPSQAGTAFQTQQSVQADSVNIQFQFFVGNNDSGADGISLTAIDLDRMTTYVGQSGGGIGYLGLPGWSLELDTWYNGWDETSTDHVSFHIDGDVYSPQHTANLPNLEDNQWHEAIITMDGNELTVSIDGTKYLDAVTVSGNTSFPAYIGFTGATGAAMNLQLIDELVVTDYACEE